MLLKELMKEAGFSQYRLAVESGVPHATEWFTDRKNKDRTLRIGNAL